MKTLIFGIAVFVSLPALADCPSLGGSYFCKYDDGDVSIMIIKEVEKNGVRMYKLNDLPLIADGVTRTQTVTLSDGEVITRSNTVTCSENKLTYKESNTIVGEDTPANSYENEISIDAWGDVIHVQNLSFGETGKIRVKSTCEKF